MAFDEQKLFNYITKTKFIENKYECWEFVCDIYKKEYGIILPEYPVDEVEAEFKQKVVSNIPNKRIEKGGEPKEGDIIVFSLFVNQHAGVMINKESFIHLTEKGVKVTDLDDVGGNYVFYRKID